MKNSVLCLLLVLSGTFINSAIAGPGTISGRISTYTGKPAVFASVLLLKSGDSVAAKTELTNEKGEFEFSSVASSRYFIKVLLMGYQTYLSDTLTVAGNALSLPDISLQEKDASLKEITVSAQKPFIEVHPDKLVINVENSIVSSGSSVLDVLARSPGVTVDQNDNVSLKGKQGVNIMIDGRIVPVSSTDLANMLKSMPSNSVDKIEIISNPSAKYDAAGTAGIINIKTKKDRGMGLNGSVNGSYGQGVYAKENAGFNLNYREKKINVYANYNANYRIGFNHVDWDRQYYTNGVYTGSYIQDNYTVQTFHTNIAAAGADYSINSKTTIGLSATGENYYLGSKGYYFAKVYDPNNDLQSYFATNNSASGVWNNYAPNLHLQHSFDSSGTELTVDADYARYWNTNRQDFTTRYLALDGTEYQPDSILHGDISGATQIRSVKADYTHSLKKNAKIEAGLKTSFVTADNQPRFYNRSNGGNVYDSSKSDHFIYNENINALYVSISKDGKKWSSHMGLRAEQTIVTGDEKISDQSFQRNYLQLFPSFAVQDHLNVNNDLGITLSRRIERPGYDDLNPYKFFVDPSTVKDGNPYLNPALTYSAELSHTYKQRLITTFNYNITNDVITEVIMPSATQDRVTIQTKENLATLRYYGLSGSYTTPIFKWWINITNFDAYYAQYQGDLANTALNNGKPTFDIYTNNKLTLPKGWSAEVSFFYQTAQVYGFLNLSEISMLNAGVQKNLLDKRLTIRLSANDIFWNGNENGSSYFVNYNEAFVAKHDTRQVTLAATYRFGNNAAQPVHHKSGAEEEKTRAGASNV